MFHNVKLVLAGALLVGATAAQAAGPNFAFERLWLDPAAVNTMVVGTGEIAPEGASRLFVAGHWEHQPLVLKGTSLWGNGVLGGEKDLDHDVVGDRATVHLGGAISFTKNLEANISLPVIAWQRGSKDPSVQQVPRSGLGTPTVGLRYVLSRQSDNGVNVTAAGEVGPLLGEDPAYGTSRFWTFTPRIEFGHQFTGWVFGGQLGGLVRTSTTAINGTTLGSELLWGLTAATTNKPLRFEASVRGNLTDRGVERSAEALVGARYQFAKSFEAFALGGPGFWKEPGTPQWRGVVGIAFLGAPPPPPPPPDPCAPGKTHTPEQCPALDDDKDGVKNADDACPLVAGPAENKGCPDKDTDGDGIVDRLDKCPTVAGVKELEGCPDKDTDGDGIVDRLDKCPDVPGVKEAEGCPAVDTDKDGILDYLDKCPTEKGDAAHQGCPPPKAEINATTGKIDILDKVFFDTSKSTIQARSLPILDAVAKVLNDNPQVKKVLVEGHTDSMGAPAMNKKLSADRAAAVKAYLVGKGVAADRLDTEGFGQDKPIADNKTAAGRDQNRRVEFTIK